MEKQADSYFFGRWMLRKFQGEPLKSEHALRMSASFLMTLSRAGFLTLAPGIRRCGFHPWVRKIPWRRKWQPTPVFLSEESHGRRSLVGYGLPGASMRNPIRDKVMRQRSDGQGESNLRASPWYFLSMYPKKPKSAGLCILLFHSSDTLWKK